MLRQGDGAEISMRISWARSVAALFAGLLGTLLIAASAGASRSSSDQVIAKFTSDSEAGQAL